MSSLPKPVLKRRVGSKPQEPVQVRDPNKPTRPLVRRTGKYTTEVPEQYRGILTLDEYRAVEARRQEIEAQRLATRGESDGGSHRLLTDVDFEREEARELLMDPDADKSAEDEDQDAGGDDEEASMIMTSQARPQLAQEVDPDEVIDFETGAHFPGTGPAKSFHPPTQNKTSSIQRFEEHARMHNRNIQHHVENLRKTSSTSSPCPRISALTTTANSHSTQRTLSTLDSDPDDSFEMNGAPAKGTPLNPWTPVRSATTAKHRRQRNAVPDESDNASDKAGSGRHRSKKRASKKKKKSNAPTEEESESEPLEDEEDLTSASEAEETAGLGKRKRASKKKTTSEKEKKLAKKQRNDNRACRRQYDSQTQTVIDAASDELNARILTSNPMAEDEDIAIHAGHAWENACRNTGLNIKLNGEIVAVLKSMLGSLQSRIKGAVRAQIMAEFQFGNSTSANAENKELARRLLKHLPQNDQQSGLYRNSIIENTVKECYFKGPKDIGVKFPALFGPIPLEVIAHIVTIMHFCIAQFNSENGARKNNHFRLDENRGRFKQYLGSLHDWRNRDGQMQVVADLQVSLYTAAREHSRTAEAAVAGDVDLPTDFYVEEYNGD